MTDFEVMPIGTREAVKDTALFLRTMERIQKMRFDAAIAIRPIRRVAAENSARYRALAERLEALLNG